MGRHSASRSDEDEGVLLAPAAAPAVTDRPRPGRHSRTDEERAATPDPSALAAPKPRPGQAGDEPAEPESAVPIAEQETERIGLLEVAMAAEADALPGADALPEAQSAPDTTELVDIVTPPPAPTTAKPVESANSAKPTKSPKLAKPAKPAKPPRAARIARGNQSTSADLTLLREHSEVRARVIAAIVAPFVLYTTVLLLIGAMDVYLIWIWIPLVTAGVTAGSILDAAHRRRAAAADESAKPPEA